MTVIIALTLATLTTTATALGAQGDDSLLRPGSELIARLLANVEDANLANVEDLEEEGRSAESGKSQGVYQERVKAAEARKKKGKLKIAACIAGGLRDAPKCKRSLRSVLGNSIDNRANTLSTYIATWSDFETKKVTSKENEVLHDDAILKDMYGSAFNVRGVKLLAHDLDMSALRRVSPELYSNNLSHRKPIDYLQPELKHFENPYHMYYLWEECLNMVDDADVIIKLRPDMFFRRASFQWKGRDEASGWPLLSFLGKDYVLSDDRIFVLGSKIHDGYADDTLVFGSSAAMNRGLRDLKHSIDSGAHKFSDADYSLRYADWNQTTSFLAPFPPESPWKEGFPEQLFTHHLSDVGLKVVTVGPRTAVGDVETCRAGAPTLGVPQKRYKPQEQYKMKQIDAEFEKYLREEASAEAAKKKKTLADAKV